MDRDGHSVSGLPSFPHHGYQGTGGGAQAHIGRGFQVEVLRSSTGRADQLDDRALCQYMLRHLNEIDELVLLTSDKHYWDAVWQYLQRGRHVVLIHFAPLSIVYPRSHTRLTVVNGVQRLWRLLRFEGRLTEL